MPVHSVAPTKDMDSTKAVDSPLIRIYTKSPILEMPSRFAATPPHIVFASLPCPEETSEAVRSPVEKLKHRVHQATLEQLQAWISRAKRPHKSLWNGTASHFCIQSLQ